MLWILILASSLIGTHGYWWWTTTTERVTKEPPQRLASGYYHYPEYMGQERLVSLTEEIVKDVELKMVMAQYVQQSYYGTFDYEVGYMAAAVKDLFKHMLQMYRDHSDPFEYANNTLNSGIYLDLLHKFQSDYREILMFKDLYLKVAFDEERRQKKERQITRFKHMRKKTQLNIKGSGPEALSREAVVPEEYFRPSIVPSFEKNKRTLMPGQKVPLNSAEWAALQTLRSGKGGSLRSGNRSRKIQDEQKYKALLRENFNARRGEQHEPSF